MEKVVASVQLREGLEPFPGYTLRRLLGRGGFGEVWAARTKDGQMLALKFLPCNNGRTTSQELRSLQVIRQLTHPRLIRIDRTWCHLGHIILAMELADGSLRDMLEICQADFGVPVMPEFVCSLLAQAAEAIDFLNSPQHVVNGNRVGIQHRDIKPSNLLLFGDTVKVCDFGLVALRADQFQVPAGTLAYSAPEVFQGRVSDRTDQFALAVTYCELRGGRRPFGFPPTHFVRNYSHPPPDLSMLPEKEAVIVAQALSPSPADRWPSCVEMMDRLSQTIAQ
jgi:serine/threonine-protein kinase